MSVRYPILNALPPAEAAAIEEQSDAGIPLSDAQAARLGIRGDSIILLPIDGKLTQEQIRTAFPNADAVMKDIVRIATKKETEHDRAGV